MKRIFTSTLLLVGLTACGIQETSNLADDLSETTSEAVLKNVEVKPTNGGINPSYFAYTVTGNVMLGSNSCRAFGADAQLIQEKVGDVIYVKAVLTQPDDAHERICPAVFRPVTKHLEMTVRGNSEEISDVIIMHVEKRDNNLSVEKLINAEKDVPGAFKLYDVPSATPYPDCDVYTSLTLVKKDEQLLAVLENRLIGICDLAVEPNKRTYELTGGESNECGTRYFIGFSPEKDNKILDPEANWKIEITDHRNFQCRNAVPAQVIIKEINQGQNEKTLFSLGGDISI